MVYWCIEGPKRNFKTVSVLMFGNNFDIDEAMMKAIAVNGKRSFWFKNEIENVKGKSHKYPAKLHSVMVYRHT